MFWDNLIQNNMVRARPKDIAKMPPGIIFALTGLWQGRGRYTQDSMSKQDKKQVGKTDARTR